MQKTLNKLNLVKLLIWCFALSIAINKKAMAHESNERTTEQKLCMYAHEEIEISAYEDLNRLNDSIKYLGFKTVSVGELRRPLESIINMYDASLIPYMKKGMATPAFNKAYKETYNSIYSRAKEMKSKLDALNPDGYYNSPYDLIAIQHGMVDIMFNMVDYYFTGCMNSADIRF